MRPPMVHLQVAHAGRPLVQFIFVLHLIIPSYTTDWLEAARPHRSAPGLVSREYRYGFSRTAGLSYRCQGGQFFARRRATVPDAARGQPDYPKTRGLAWT